jgi:hypothetical protein
VHDLKPVLEVRVVCGFFFDVVEDF